LGYTSDIIKSYYYYIISSLSLRLYALLYSALCCYFRVGCRGRWCEYRRLRGRAACVQGTTAHSSLHVAKNPQDQI